MACEYGRLMTQLSHWACPIAIGRSATKLRMFTTPLIGISQRSSAVHKVLTPPIYCMAINNLSVLKKASEKPTTLKIKRRLKEQISLKKTYASYVVKKVQECYSTSFKSNPSVYFRTSTTLSPTIWKYASSKSLLVVFNTFILYASITMVSSTNCWSLLA